MSEDDDPYLIEIRDTCEIVPIDGKRIEEAVRYALRHCRVPGCDLSVAIVDDAAITRLNEQFRGEPHSTDVLSFDLRGSPSRDTVEGEVVVSAETARRQAENGRDAAAELLLYVVHGCLHLAGQDDRTPGDSARMHAAENEILTRLGYGAVYGEVQT